MAVFISESPAETEAIAAAFAKTLRAPAVLAFCGGLGMGKTAFTRGLAKGLGIEARVNSPTFALVHTYEGNGALLHHFDMYRVESWEDLETTGYFDALESGGILAVEWSENIENALPETAIRITIKRGESETQRIITIENGE